MAKEIIRNDKGEPFSKWKPSPKFEWVLWSEFSAFANHCVKEFEFSPDRKWRLDFAWPDLKVGVEIDGFGFGHQAQQCMAEDNEKANAAVELGWRVLRFNSRQLGSKRGVYEAVEQVCQIISEAA